MASFSEFIELPDDTPRSYGPHPVPPPPALQILDNYESLMRAIQSRRNQRVPLNVCFLTTVHTGLWERREMQENIRNIVKTYGFLECGPSNADVIISQGFCHPTTRRSFFTQVLGPRTFSGEIQEVARAVARAFISAIETHRAKGHTEAHFFTWML